MKHLLNTLYVTSNQRYLSLDGENVVVLEKEAEIGRVPLHNLQSIVTFGYTGASPALMGACAQRNIDLSFMSGNGRFLARVSGEVKGNVTLRKQQFRISESSEQSMAIAKNFILGKVFNARWVLERAARDYPMRLNLKKSRKFFTEVWKISEIVIILHHCLGWKESVHQYIFLYLMILFYSRKKIFIFMVVISVPHWIMSMQCFRLRILCLPECVVLL